MIRRKLESLAIFELQDETDTIPLNSLRDLYIEKTSNIVYFTLHEKLFGIICSRDLPNNAKEDTVPIVRKFTRLIGFQDDEARQIFAENSYSKIPVVDQNGCLLGDYSRWSDTEKLYIEWIVSHEEEWKKLKKFLKDKQYSKIYIVNPVKEKLWLKEVVDKIFEIQKVDFISVQKDQMDQLLHETEKILVVLMDMEELYGTQCLVGNIFIQTHDNMSLFNFSQLWQQLIRYIGSKSTVRYSIVNKYNKDDQPLKYLQEKGVHTIAIYNDVYYVSEYIKNLIMCIADNNKNYKMQDVFWSPNTEVWKKFFGDLLENKDYQNGVAQNEILHGLQRNYTGRYYNMVEGYRKTCYQPSHYYNTIYIFGTCIIWGRGLEDKYTMASQLQKKLNDEGYRYIVRNCGSTMYKPVFYEMSKIPFCEGDVVIVYTGTDTYDDIESVDIRHVFEHNNVPAEWCTDIIPHMNHRAMGLIVEELFCKLKKYLVNDQKQVGRKEILLGNEYENSFKRLIKLAYLNVWFKNIDICKIKGCIVADWNISPLSFANFLPEIYDKIEELVLFLPLPIGKGRYGIEEYISAFIEMTMYKYDVKIVFGEECVPYFYLFESYYNSGLLDTEEAVEDVEIFAKYIAKPLNIKFRFGYMMGSSEKMKQYSQILKTEMPQYGIQYVELADE